jgi:hypothetical protein
MTRSLILFTKFVFAAINALLWSRALALLSLPAVVEANLWQRLLVAAILAGACAQIMLAGIDRFVGTNIDPHTYSAAKDTTFQLLTGSLNICLLFGLLISLVLWQFIFLHWQFAALSLDTLFWDRRISPFLDGPILLVLFTFLVKHRRMKISRELLEDRGAVFDSWW